MRSTGQLLLSSPTAADEQAQCEVAKTLSRLAGNSPAVLALAQSLQPGAAAATQTVACRRSLQRLLGAMPSGALQDRRTADGGFTAYPGFATASLLDTGWALQSELQGLAPADGAALIAWLQSRQQPDGSFLQGAGTSLSATAAILLGLKPMVGSSTVAAAVASKATNYLLSRRNADGSWGSDIGLTASVFEAVPSQFGLASRHCLAVCTRGVVSERLKCFQ